jgi:hypothetical protein
VGANLFEKACTVCTANGEFFRGGKLLMPILISLTGIFALDFSKV